MEAWGKKIKQSRHAKIPDGIAVLAEKIGVDSDSNMAIGGSSLYDVDPDSLVDRMCGFSNEEDGLMYQNINVQDVGR